MGREKGVKNFMSVPKSRRSESKAEFLNKCRELKLMTYKKCAKLPKRLQASLGNSLISQATNVKRYVTKANNIFPISTKGEYEERRKGFKLALAELNSMSSDVDDLYDLANYDSNAIGEWQDLIDVTFALVKGVLDSDARSYKF